MTRTDRESVKEEASDLLSSLEEFLLELEQIPDDLELVGMVLTELRAVRGSDGEDLAAFIRKVWNLRDKVKNGEIRVIRKLIDLTLEARNSLRSIVDGLSTPHPPLRATAAALKQMVIEEAKEGRSRPRRGPRRSPNNGDIPGFPVDKVEPS